MKKPYQIEAQRAVKQLEAMAADDGNPAVPAMRWKNESICSNAASFAVGAGYGLWTIFTQSNVTDSAVLLIVLAVIVFLVGLVSEQIAALRFDGRK